MDTLRDITGRLTFQHAFMVVLAISIVYLFRAENSYVLHPIWRRRVDKLNYVNENYPTSNDRLPSPIITDLESDGINEIILVTNDMTLSVMALPDSNLHTIEDDTLPHVIVKKRVNLPLTVLEDGRQNRPIVMKTGYLQAYKSMVQIRTQVIVLVTDDWQVFCYDHNLTMKWNTTLMDIGQSREKYYVNSMAVLITGHNVHKGDSGTVIIGGSMEHKAHKGMVNESDSIHHGTADRSFAHFSSFALGGSDGSVRWHHLPGDFEAAKSEETASSKEYHWKLALRKHSHHVGELPWSHYKQQVVRNMPHRWADLKDTSITIDRFQRLQSDETSNSPASLLEAEHIIGYAYGGQRPHSPEEHLVNPNAVVIHHPTGLEVLSIRTGMPITRLRLPTDGAVYVDINGDGDLERLVWGIASGACNLEIQSVFPVRKTLKELSACTTLRNIFSWSWSYQEDFTKRVPPTVVQSIAKRPGLFSHILGHRLTSKVHQHDIILTGSTGRVTSLGPSMEHYWQVPTSATWSDIAAKLKLDKTLLELHDRYHNSFQPCSQAFSMQVFEKQNVMVVAGWDTLSVLDLQDGHVVAEHSIPSYPTAPLVIGDFDNDGWNDIILTCERGYIGFVIHKQPNHVYTALYALCVFISIVFVTYSLGPSGVEDTDE